VIAETCVIFGEAVKALGDNDGRVGGYLVRFSTEKDPDISDMKDFFTSGTNFDMPDGTKSTSVYYNHGLDAQIKKRKIGTGTMKVDDIGVWVEAQLNLADEYDKAVYEMAKDGALGWSSGTASHLIDREAKDNGTHEIKSWPLGLDASLTPTPAEPRTKQIFSLKSWAIENDLINEDGTQGGRTLEDQTKSVVNEIEDFTKRLTALKALRLERGKRDLTVSARKHLEVTTSAIKTLLDELEALRTEPNTAAEADSNTSTAPDESVTRAWETLLNSY